MKIQQISEIYPTLPMTEFDFAAKYRAGFAASELGRIHTLLPLSEMASAIAIRFPKRNPQGKKPMFSPEGEIALMFLKSYTGLSDDGLIEMLNGSVYMQMFCGVLLDPSNPIKDGKIVSAIRNRLARKLNIEALEKPRACDPRSPSAADPRKQFKNDPYKVLAGGVIFIWSYLLPLRALIFLRLSPASSI